jgi:hypothetical protein
MTDRDLTTLLERASADLPELDFAEPAWSAALEQRARRRRQAWGGLAAVAAVGVIAAVFQVSSPPTPHPLPSAPTTTHGVRQLPDGTAYAVMPMEGTEAELPDFAVGLPSAVDVHARGLPLSTLVANPQAVEAVYLREVGSGYRPVLVTSDGEQVIADTVMLSPTRDDAKPPNAGVPLGVRAIGGGHYVAFPQPRAVVILDTETGQVRSIPVPADDLVAAAWTSDQGTIIARATTRAWSIDPWAPGAHATPVPADVYPGSYRLSAASGAAHLAVTRQNLDNTPDSAVDLSAPVTDVWGDTVNTLAWAAAGAFLDQNAVYSVIRRGFGPIYQGLVAVPADGSGGPQLLLAPENPDGQTGRFKGCCTVLGWADGTTVLFRSYGSHGVWVLAWNIRTGTVYQVTRMGALSGSGVPTAIALNVGWRY